MRRCGFDWTKAAAALSLGVIAAALIAVCCRDCRARRECEAKGGHVEEFDCITTVHCTTHSAGKSSYTTCTPIRSCRWRCAGLPAEDPR